MGDEAVGKRPWIVELRILDLFCGQERTLSGFMQNNMFLRTLSGEGNGTPLQYSCLENPMDGGAW